MVYLRGLETRLEILSRHHISFSGEREAGLAERSKLPRISFASTSSQVDGWRLSVRRLYVQGARARVRGDVGSTDA